MLTISEIFQPTVSYFGLHDSIIWQMRGSDVFGIHLFAFYHRAEITLGTFNARQLVTQIKQHIEMYHQDGLIRHYHLAQFTIERSLSAEDIHLYLQNLQPNDRELLRFTLYSGYGIDEAKQLTWVQVNDIWHSLSPILQTLVNKQMRNTQSELLFSTATTQGYRLPALSATDVLSATGNSHQSLVASFNLHLVAQAACQADTIRLQLGIKGI
ncbi:hypothetical protein ACK30K_20625 [Aeromonas caviae]|uniref:Uncharacterized protein n=1 Tax=Aeromonas caviae TaxID=648 RepID=A0A3S5WX34_AERCA|nr:MULTISPECIES: hypothetical protein [Aeromonas]AXB06577.1 hypothetical protein C1C91_17735 [Aeromonas caviae]AXB08699.1 hypothetical protein C0708_08250 [Aeromonas caviae]QXB95472.1 hypothetical protein I6L36_00565 [Aeromonas sp. FDAARGOS 1406]